MNSMIGQVIQDRYKIIEQVGVGGMAHVYKAEDLLLKRDVAVKVLKQQYIEDEEFSEKFQIEAQSAARLSHPNIVNIYDVGSDKVNEQTVNYIVMEYIEGRTLKEIIVEKGELPNEEIVNYGMQIADALYAAHRKDVIHRDIKPQNIMITDEGMVKVTDFGIARISTSATITYTSSILGTVHYISPEQAKGKFIDNKSDIYSLGIVLYEMATGEVPFDAENSVGIALKHIQDQAIEPIELNANLSPKLNDIIMKCLDKRPEARFDKANDLARALSSYEVFEVNTLDDTAPHPGLGSRLKRKENNTQKAIYETKNYNDDVSDEELPKSKKILPILLSFVLVVLLFFVVNYIRGSNNQEPISVPDVLGKSEAEALTLISNSGLEYNILREFDNEVDKGYVISQKPSKNTIVDPDTRVDLTISDGIEEISMPNVIGMTLDEAETTLQASGLSINSETYIFSDTVEAGKVIETNPSPGQNVTGQSNISISISNGKEELLISMPNLLGSSQATAVKTLMDVGLDVGSVDYMYSSEYPEDTVMWQSYDEGVELKENTRVDISISRGKDQAQNLDLPPNTIDLTGDTSTNDGMKVYTFEIQPPSKGEGEDLFNLRITKDTENGELGVYNDNHLISNGNFDISFKDYIGSTYNIYYDDELVLETN